MNLLGFAGFIGLAGSIGWLWHDVQTLKGQVFLSRISEREQLARTNIQAQRDRGEARMREATRRWPS